MNMAINYLRAPERNVNQQHANVHHAEPIEMFIETVTVPIVIDGKDMKLQKTQSATKLTTLMTSISTKKLMKI